MTIDLDTLKGLAKAATQGRWDYSGHEVFLKSIDYWPVVANCRNKSNAAYIAAVNPQVVLELIAELQKVKAERDWLANTLADYCSHTTGDEQANCGIMPCPKRKINIRCLNVEKCNWLTVVISTVSMAQATEEWNALPKEAK